MRPKTCWVCLLGLAALVGSAAVAVGETDTYQPLKPKKQSRWWWPWGGSKEKEKKAAKPAKPKTTVFKPKATQTPPTDDLSGPSFAKERASLLTREQAKVLRRQQMCDRLREIGRQTNDISLQTQAQLLEQKAWFLYEQRTGPDQLSQTLIPEGSSAERDVVSEAAGRNELAERPYRRVSARDQAAGSEEE